MGDFLGRYRHLLKQTFEPLSDSVKRAFDALPAHAWQEFRAILRTPVREDPAPGDPNSDRGVGEPARSAAATPEEIAQRLADWYARYIKPYERK